MGEAAQEMPAGLTTCDLRRRKRRLLQNPSALQSGARQGRLSLTIAEWESGTAPQNIRVGLRHPHRNLPLREAAGRQSVRPVGIGSECTPPAGTHAVRCAGCRKEECRIWVFSHRVSIVRHSQFDGSSVGFATPFGSFRSLFWSVSALFVDGFRGAKANLPPICASRGAGLAGLW